MMSREHQRTTSIDSAFSDDEVSTVSMNESNYQHEEAHGRTYHSSGRYWLPNDDAALASEETLHTIITNLMDGRQFYAPLNSLEHVLDVGTGSGLWAIALADAYPGCTVRGTDISPVQPNWVPPNCLFEIFDAESVWSYSRQFDLIHTRCMFDYSLYDWPEFFYQAHKALRPGGWLEMHEIDYSPQNTRQAANKPLALCTWAAEWRRGYMESGRKGSCNREEVVQFLTEAGFLNIRVHTLLIPVGQWNQDTTLQQAGEAFREVFVEEIAGWSARCFLDYLSYGREEFELLLMQCRKELSRNDLAICFPLHIIMAQKADF